MNTKQALAALLQASYDHMASNGDAPVGRDGRQRMTPSMILADHAMLGAMEIAREALGLNQTHAQLLDEASRRNWHRACEKLGRAFAEKLPEFAKFQSAGPLFKAEDDSRRKSTAL